MIVKLVHKHYDRDHLDAVKAQMALMGAPIIKAVWMECYGLWAALEGCHRLRAAKELGLTPEIEEIEYSETLRLVDIGIADGWEYTVAEIADDLYDAELMEFAE